MTANVSLADAIKQLRAQLEEAQSEGKGKALRFAAKNVEVELNIVFKSEVEGGAGVKAWFLDVSGKGRASGEATHRIKLVLEPFDESGKPVQVGDTILHEKDEER